MKNRRCFGAMAVIGIQNRKYFPVTSFNLSFGIISIVWMWLIIVTLLVGCEGRQKQTSTEKKSQTVVSIPAPNFNKDSAYYFVSKQVAFGPRVPNTAAHVNCGDYLIQMLKAYTPKVVVQEFQAQAFDGKQLRLRNIIASINPEQKKRILIATHWDSRPFAEKDSVRKNVPIDGANDGGSGVGIVLEMARAIKTSGRLPQVGIDILLFDGEDYGRSQGMPGKSEGETWCLGSQHWSRNKHEPGYAAYYGVLLDMVGAKGAKFAMEGTSMEYAPEVTKKIWEQAQRSGYGGYFIYYKSESITDDHVFVNEVAKIPMTDIIDFDIAKNKYFGWYHHTHADNMSIIDPNTLKAVGQTVLDVIYKE